MNKKELLETLKDYENDYILEEINEIIWDTGSPMQFVKYTPMSSSELQRIETQRKNLFRIEQALKILNEIKEI